MNLTRCNNGHFYDADKYNTCPHCSDASSSAAGPNDPTVGKINNGPGFTEKINQEVNTPPSDSSKSDHSSSLKGAVDDVQKTIGIFNTDKGKEPVVGWLVCVEGNHYGEDFKIRMGRNFIGRSKNMDIVLANDSSVSREKHSIIVYEPKENIFIIQAGESKELSYLNDKVILSPQALCAYDKIKLGASTLLFVPLCSDRFTWEHSDEQKD